MQDSPLKDKQLKAQIQAAAKRGVAYLKRLQSKDGPWREQWRAGSIRRFLTTVLVLHAMAVSGVGAGDASVKRALRWLRFRQQENGFARAFRVVGQNRVLIDEGAFFEIIEEQNASQTWAANSTSNPGPWVAQS